MKKKLLIPALCALPVVGIIVWNLSGGNISTMATLGLILACPLSHIFLMKHNKDNMKGGDHKHE